MSAETHCPLCSGLKILPYHEDGRRGYCRCEHCALVFVPPRWHLSREDERAAYDFHQNEIHDPGYRNFLSRLARPLIQRLQPGAEGLDFGCGPGPALADILETAGFAMTLYDSFYRPQAGALERSYDFICASEVVEHLHRPGYELERLWSLLVPGGWLGVMTKLVRDREAFADWHYKNDPTHVCFFSTDTWRWWAGLHDAELEFIGADVMLLRKNA